MNATSRRLPAWRGWGMIVLLPALVLVCTPSDWPRWSLMWLLTGAIFASCKWLTWRRTPVDGPPVWKHVAYLFAWPGLDARAFLQRPQRAVEPPGVGEWLTGSGKVVLGAGLFWEAGCFIGSDQELLMGWLGMAGFVLMVHFGAFDLLSCLWRARGLDARPLMDRPIFSRSVGEFWAKRWNTAFRDLTYRFLFRPLAPRGGTVVALGAVFLFSGLVHDLVISVPARGGYGGPTLYFLVQVPAVLAERSRFGKRIGLGSGWLGRTFALLVLAGPAWILFHPPFIRNIVLPYMRAVGAG